MWKIFAFSALVSISCAFPVFSKDNLVGNPLFKDLSGKIVLGADLGAGKRFKPSPPNNFQSWGVQKVSRKSGHPTRLGNFSLRFETREGFCGWDNSGWNDCKMGRSRHELTTASIGNDNMNAENWYALSVFAPISFRVPNSIGTSLFQFLINGKPSWMFKFSNGKGFMLQREFDWMRKPLVPTSKFVNRWNDIVVRVVHSKSEKKGLFHVWINGRLAYSYRGRTVHYKSQGRKPFFKFGIYNTALKDGKPVDGEGFLNGKGLPNLVLYFDEVRYGGSCSALKLNDLGYNCSRLISALGG